MKQQTAPVSSLTQSTIGKAIALADAGQIDDALTVLSHLKGTDPAVANARGVCLLRSNRVMEALRLYRTLVLRPGCTWMKPDLPIIYRTNFSTSLMLANIPTGVRDTLNEIREPDHPSVSRLWQALKHWERQLTWWQRLQWKMGSAAEVPITIDFPPGDFVDPLHDSLTRPANAVPVKDPAHHQVA